MNHRIKEFREMLGLSQADFAKAAELQTAQIRGYEENTTKPSIAAIEKIAETYKVNPAWLVGWSEHINSNNKPNRVCYVSDGPTRIPPYLDTDKIGHIIRWRQTQRPYIGTRKEK